ncbi:MULTISPECIES: class I SAM-dependent methyltransferase [unclassified Solwaraspora]|uniref:class I SAM-dependent methyltransferase n=1 Tax=unclassified Solwaraspora TaxID=2627926 RepID=UPI00259B8CC5|nr:class I SAM-dependent methyltransferase [Solwaraspora sp. WMMA2056]WJK40560.1 class I SAM-dependent methyltransferase [Solwaraspora sp. WMMA2056]
MTADYLDINRASWDERAPAHAASPDYRVAELLADPTGLSDVVRFDVPRLGDLTGVRGVHLQCHIGTDTLSLARLGATMTGLDLSGASLAEARRIAAAAQTHIEYVEADVYRAVEVLGAGRFDLVFTGIGALCWLPSARRWAETVAGLLRPGGRLFLREGHPALWAIDETRPDGLLVLDLPYFETEQPLVWDEAGTYVDTDANFTHNLTHSWNHGIGEIFTALTAAGLRVTDLVEHDSVPWNALPGRMTRGDDGEWRLTERPQRLPLSYTLQAVKLS